MQYKTKISAFASSSPRREYLPLILLISGGLCLGLSPMLVKAIPLPSEISAFYRVLFSIVPIFIWVTVTQKPKEPPKSTTARPLTVYLFLGLASFFSQPICW